MGVSSLWSSCVPTNSLDGWSFYNGQEWVPNVPEGGGSGNGCLCCGQTPFVCSSLALKLIDANHSERYVAGGTLKMVSDGAQRSANIQILNLPASFSSTSSSPPIWNGSGVSGSGVTASCSTSSSVEASVVLKSGCSSIEGQIEIVPEDRMSISFDSNVFEPIKDAMQSGIGDYTTGPNFSVEFSGSLSGTAKNVDKYGVGSSTGDYIDASGEISVEFRNAIFETPALPIYGIIQAKAKIAFGSVSGSASIHGTYDESQASCGSISGKLLATLNGASLEIYCYTGNYELCSLGIAGTGTIGSISFGGDIGYKEKQLYFKPELNFRVSIITMDAMFTVGDYECRYEIAEVVLTPSSYMYSKVILWKKN